MNNSNIISEVFQNFLHFSSIELFFKEKNYFKRSANQRGIDKHPSETAPLLPRCTLTGSMRHLNIALVFTICSRFDTNCLSKFVSYRDKRRSGMRTVLSNINCVSRRRNAYNPPSDCQSSMKKLSNRSTSRLQPPPVTTGKSGSQTRQPS